MRSNIIPILLKDREDYPEETPIYKYLSVDKFLYLNKKRAIYWPNKKLARFLRRYKIRFITAHS